MKKTSKRKRKTFKLDVFRKVLMSVLCGVLLTAPTYLNGQELVTVRGVITESSGEALPGVNVVVKGTTQGTVTDMNGNYNIDAASDATLIFSFIGYEVHEAAVEGRSVLNITLVQLAIGIEEVVAIGYSTQSRRNVTSSVSKIDAEELQNIPSISPVQALQGKMAGVSVPVLSGQPGEAPHIVIRGGTTLTPYGTGSTRNVPTEVGGREASDPLYIVDGVFRSIADINPEDIESIQIMKDAASTAIYGARGANGVVVVKTKTGKNSGGKANFRYKYQHGIETQARDYGYLDAKEYINLVRPIMNAGIDNYDPERFLFNGGNAASILTLSTPGQYGQYKFTTTYLDNLVDIEGQDYVNNLLSNGWETMVDPVFPDKTIIYKDSHYQDVVWQTAHTNSYNFSVDGGTEDANYNISLGYADQGGVFIGTSYERLSALANAGFKLNDKLRMNINFSYLWSDNKTVDDVQWDMVRAIRIPSLNRLYNDDGKPNLGESYTVRNRLHTLYYDDDNITSATFTMRMAFDYEILPGLYYRPSASLNTINHNRMNSEKFYPQDGSYRGKDQRQYETNQIMTDHIFHFTKEVAEGHNLMVLGGFNYTIENYYQVIAQSIRSATDYITTITGDPASMTINGNVSPNFTASSFFNETKSASLFGQLSYDINDKYLFSASIRRDGFSDFAPENRFATFPSLSAGWIISNENFWSIDKISLLKLRTSWGKTGLSNLSTSDTYGAYRATVYATNSGIIRNNLPNPNLLWETTDAVDAGIDMGLFNNRLIITFDAYSKLTDNRLAYLPLPAETGFSSIKYNVGSLRNKGVELEISASIIEKSNFSWYSSFSFAFNRTFIVDLPDNGRDKNRIYGGEVYDVASGQYIEAGGYAEGERPLGLWAFQSNGIFATDEEAAAVTSGQIDMAVPGANQGKVKHAGDVNWADLNGDNIIDGNDLVFQGYRVPDKIGGMQNTFKYKGFSLRIAMDYALGHVISNGALARSMGQARSYNEGAPGEAVGPDTWQVQGDEGKIYPRFSLGDWDQGYRNHLRLINYTVGYYGMGVGDAYGTDNSIYIEKGDFLALREVSLSYELPKSICQRLFLKSIVLQAGVYNVGYLTAYSGFNPEIYKGVDAGEYPRPRQFTFGANIKF